MWCWALTTFTLLSNSPNAAYLFLSRHLTPKHIESTHLPNFPLVPGCWSGTQYVFLQYFLGYSSAILYSFNLHVLATFVQFLKFVTESDAPSILTPNLPKPFLSTWHPNMPSSSAPLCSGLLQSICDYITCYCTVKCGSLMSRVSCFNSSAILSSDTPCYQDIR